MIAPLASGLPDFPWDRLENAHATAKAHPDGEIDLSIGTPVDDTPEVIQAALSAHSNAPGYPTAAGLPQLREAWSRWVKRTLTVDVAPDAIAPLVGSKELVALLPFALGLRAGTVIAIPELAYPTYAVGAMIAGADFVTYRTAQEIPDNVSLIWVNTPGNPTGAVLDASELTAIVAHGRAIGSPVVSDECYVELGWDAQPVSVLEVAGASHEGVLSVQSLSKRSNLAGYRSGAVLGDTSLVAAIVGMRKHAGLLMPTPVQYASIAALDDDEHVAVQKERYRARREVLKRDLTSAGFDISHSEAGLYLWATRGENCMTTIGWLAERGIVAAPGDFYGPAGANHIRVALTVSDKQVAQVASRLG